MPTTRTQVAIIGGGPAGLLLSHMLDRNGVDSIVLERQSRAYVLERIRAGVLEAGTIDLLRAVGLGAQMDREGLPHDGTAIAWEGKPRFFIDTKKHTGKGMMAYGQTAITEDLYAVRDAAGGQIIDEAAKRGAARPHIVAALRDLWQKWPASAHRLRLYRWLRWLSWSQPDIDPGRRAANF